MVVGVTCQLSSTNASHAPVAQIHLRNAGLALLDGGQTQQQAGEPGAAAIIEIQIRWCSRW